MSTAKLKLVHSTTTIEAPSPEVQDPGTQTERYALEDLMPQYAFAKPGTAVNDWREFAIYQHHIQAVSRIAAVFNACVTKWRDDTQFSSSLTQILLHPAYQRIIGLGPDAVPFVLRDLAANGGHWFWALKALTGHDPVAPADVGRTKRMAESWLSWGRANGYL